MENKEITDEILDLQNEKLIIEDADAKRDAQRKMTWVCIVGMLIYPVLVILSAVFGLQNATNVLGTMAATYFASVAAIVMSFFGSEVFINKK